MSAENRRASTVASQRDRALTSVPAPPASPGEGRASPEVDGHESDREWIGHAPLVLAALAVVLVGSVPLAEAWFVASRLAYVVLVGAWLRVESKERALSRREDPDAAWRRFRARASRLMVGDAAAFVALCIVTRGTFALDDSGWVGPVVGVLLIVLGVGIKTWATVNLPAGVFYWRDFFVPAEERTRSKKGPYRWISNPMYTLGYAHAYGFAVLLGSGPGIVGAVFAQIGVLLLAALVERPHFRSIPAIQDAPDENRNRR